MASTSIISKAALLSRSRVAAPGYGRRLLHSSTVRLAITNFQMPAMSPTMTEGGIASWKKKEGESFAQGDVLLEIETDKATIDVEAQEDGIMGKILAPDGTKGIPIGKTIALLAEEGDDISNLEIPKDDVAPPPPQEAEASSSARPPTPDSDRLVTSEPEPPQSAEAQSHGSPEHSRPLFPSVHRLLAENNITNADKIKGTGVRGMLTKGDVLAFLGQASSPLGTFKFGPSPIQEANASKAPSQKAAVPPAKAPLDGPAIRRLVVSSMLQASLKARNPVPASFKDADFDSIIADYLPASSPKPTASPTPASTSPKKSASYLEGLF